MGLSLQDRVDNYNAEWPNYPNMYFDKGWIIANWSIGACYKGSGYHGSYPHKYLKRMRSLFPDCDKSNTLHLFSGSLSPGYAGSSEFIKDFPGITFDKNAALGPDHVGDAENLSTHFPTRKFKVILADVPYTEEDAQKYGYTLVKRNQVVRECAKILMPGGFLVWMDMILPMYSKDTYKRVADLSITGSTNHRVRCSYIFEKV